MTELVVFVGNPGFKYKQTRHNTAWLFKDYINLSANWLEKFHGFYFKESNRVYLCPQTFMNESGISVQECCKFFQIKPSSVIVVHDDIELDFGIVKIQRGGGMGGHNGLRSVKQHLGTDDFWRLRFGVGRPVNGQDVASFVTGRFTEPEEALLDDMFKKGKAALDSFKGL